MRYLHMCDQFSTLKCIFTRCSHLAQNSQGETSLRLSSIALYKMKQAKQPPLYPCIDFVKKEANIKMAKETGEEEEKKEKRKMEIKFWKQSFVNKERKKLEGKVGEWEKKKHQDIS